MPPPAWQHPYVNLFKQFGVGQWKKCSKEGDVSSVMVRTNVCVYCFQSFLSPPNSPPSLCMFPQDRKIKCSVYRIAGPIPVNNYILFPLLPTTSLLNHFALPVTSSTSSLQFLTNSAMGSVRRWFFEQQHMQSDISLRTPDDFSCPSDGIQ